MEKAYEDNLELVLSEVEGLVEDIEGKTVITADHGEMFGERLGLWRHPKGVYLKELVEVPWFEVNAES